MKLPCDICMWDLIPMIKRELVLRLYNKYKLNKVSIAKKLGITKGSVTQYIQGKRASNSSRLRKIKRINIMIINLAKDIVKKRLIDKEISRRFCEICKPAQRVAGIC